MIEFLKKAACVLPSSRQLNWFDLGFYGFIHFGVNTFTDREWGDGTESEKIFAPTALDCDQWCRALKSAGMGGMILTAKHHDGFCLWPSRYTEHSVKYSSFQGDVVRLASDACRRHGLKFGFYLSPWDRNSPLYGTPDYNDYFCNQLTELLTDYGDIFCVWFDNACAPELRGRQVYDFPRYIRLIRSLQPGAVIFNDYGPDVRWCGNEAGKARHAEWAVVPGELCPYAQIQTGPGPLSGEGSLDFLYNTHPDPGALSQILYSKGLAFVPSEIDMSIRPGWFWHENENPHSLQRLFCTYLTGVGGNACLNLNVPPDRRGLIDERDVQRLKELGEMIRCHLGTPLPCRIEEMPDCPPTQKQYRITLSRPHPLRYVFLQEDISRGQRIESFLIQSGDAAPTDPALFAGTCVGRRKICPLTDPFADLNPLTGQHKPVSSILVRITAARDEVFLKSISLF